MCFDISKAVPGIQILNLLEMRDMSLDQVVGLFCFIEFLRISVGTALKFSTVLAFVSLICTMIFD